MSWMHDMHERIASIEHRHLVAKLNHSQHQANQLLEDALKAGAMREDVDVVLAYRRGTGSWNSFRPELR